jgi:hypothetical protein
MTEMTNIHNEYVWSHENRHAIWSHHQQRQLSINTSMWAGILGDCLTDPHILLARVSGRGYTEVVYCVSFNTRLHISFKYNGAPSHYSREVRQWMSESHPESWTGRRDEAPVSWPARSPDLSPHHFLFSWESI